MHWFYCFDCSVVDVFITSAVVFVLSVFLLNPYATFSFQCYFDHKSFIFLENIEQSFKYVVIVLIGCGKLIGASVIVWGEGWPVTFPSSALG